MGPKKWLFLAAVVCLLPVVTSADISRVSPQVVPFAAIETFMTVYGDDVYGTELTLITIDGPAGQFILEPSSFTINELTFWIPEVVALTPGTYTLVVEAKNFNEPLRTMGPLTFSVEEVIITGPPLLSLPEFVVAEATSANGAVVEYTASAQSTDGTPLPITCSHASGSSFPLDATQVTCFATDAYGTTEGDFFVVVTDTVWPVLTLPDNIVTEDAVVTYTASAHDAIDGSIAVTCAPASGSTFQSGLTTVRCSATDSHANRAEGSFTVLRPEQPPVITVPGDITVEALGPGGAEVDFVVTSTNNGLVVCLPQSGSTFPLGTTLVTCTATNTAGSDTGTFNVIITGDFDVTPPALILPSPIVAEATSADGAVVTYTVSAIDGVDGSVPVSCTPVSGSTFPLGVTAVECTASDASGNMATGSFTVTVRDTTAPIIISIAATPDTLWPPNHKMVDILVKAVAFDVVDDSPVVQIVSVTSSQPVNGTGDGDAAPDWEITGPMTVQLRSERAGNDDRTYTIYVEATDASGNTSTRSVTVKVTQSRRRSVR